MSIKKSPTALVQLPVPVNKFPDFVRYLVQRMKTLCPMLGKVKIAQVLARAGLHLGQTTVGRILKEKPASKSLWWSSEIRSLLWVVLLPAGPTYMGY